MTTLRGATLFDGTGADGVESASVEISDGRITSVGANRRDGEVIDLSGLTLLPGLIDAHVHFGLSTDINATLRHDVSVAEVAASMFRICEQTLMEGFTTVRDTGGSDAGIVGVVERGLIKGPRIIAAGPILCQTGGHGHFAPKWEPTCLWSCHEVPGLTSLSLVTDGVDGMRRNAREAFRRGAQFLKLCVTGGVVSTHDKLTDTQFNVDEIRAAVGEAEARGTYVTVHAHNNAGVRNAIEGGVKCIEHGTEVDDETAALMADRSVSLVPTLAVAQRLVDNASEMGLPQEIEERAANVRQGMGDGILAALKAGVKVGSGSDLIGPNQAGRGQELALKAELMGGMAALVSATKVNAEIIQRNDLGTVEPGKLADFVAFDGNPVDKPELFAEPERVVFVMRDGRVVKSNGAG